MSEYMESHSVAKLIGAPPGYVGHDDGGQLTEQVRRKPYSVVLFDEIEKAHPDVFNILLQVLDDGRITDSQGRTVDFKNTIIILTSNLGANIILDGINSDGTISAEATNEVHLLLKQSFRPEFLNRLDEIIMFKPLAKSEIVGIVDLILASVSKRLQDKQIKLEVTSAAKDQIIEQGYDVAFGARPLKRFIQHTIETSLAKTILASDIKPNTTLVVDASEEELVIADKYKQKFDEVRKEFLINIDKDDMKYIILFREYNNLFTSINFEDLTVTDMNDNTVKLDELMKKIHSLNESNNRLLVKYSGDEKYVKIHKRVLERIPEFNQVDLYEILTNLKNEIDDILLRKYDIMDTESYFKQTIMPMTLDEFDKHNITIVIDEVQFFTEVIVETYLAERSLNL
jgi:hypothetical protein